MKVDPVAELPHYGIDSRGGNVRWFGGKAAPDLLEYLDLIEPMGPQARGLVKPDGVVENQERPLLFFLNHGRLSTSAIEQEGQIRTLRRSLACRGDRAYLAIIRPGHLDVVQVSLKDKRPEWRHFQAGTTEALTFFSRLCLGRCEEFPTGKEVDFLFKEMFKLVNKVATRLESLKLKRSDVLSLVGRALFFRFLRDRGIVKESDLPKISPAAGSLEGCFDNAESAFATSAWLDKTFNGDFLPVSDEGSLDYFQSVGRRTGQRVFFHLAAIARGDEPIGDDGFQQRLPIHWGQLDFAHVPVGLLSQIYERLSWKWDHDTSKKTSVHYTPRNIAATLVGEAFDNLPEAHSARVLDPACGASVFLVIAFRRLYRELWKHTGQRPDTEAIRKILENQLVGFDISDSALKLSALSLYLTAIELDPDPVPPQKLKFKALRKGRNTILFDWRKEGDPENGPVVGSIGKHVGSRFDSKFDLILCNPPWTNIGSKHAEVSKELDEVSREIVTTLDPSLGKDYKNPDSVPDLPFIWRSMQWCKPDGRIAMALPARTLFKQGPMAAKTRKALFSLLEVNGIINASNLRKTAVWPEMAQPFMLLFARNRRPRPKHQLYFISPHTDFMANALGDMRIDPKSTRLVEVHKTFEEPWLWKALAVGTGLDVEVVRKIESTQTKNFKQHWKESLRLKSSQGYQIAEEQEDLKDASSLQGLPNLQSSTENRFLVDISRLNVFRLPKVFRTRLLKKNPDPLCNYRGPITLFHVAPGDDRTEGRALLCLVDIAYSESYYGYSTKGHPEAELLARYVQLWAHCNVLMYLALMTSAEIGFERPKFQKRDFDKSPFVAWEQISESDKRNVFILSERLITEDAAVFSDIDKFFGKLYGLSPSDIEVINDTLEVREPNDELGKRASKPPEASERKNYYSRLKSFLQPLFKVLGKQVEINPWKPSENPEHPFILFTLSEKGKTIPNSEAHLPDILKLANETGTSQIILETDGGLLVGLLRQYRYWTPSRARMLGSEIMRNHMMHFED